MKDFAESFLVAREDTQFEDKTVKSVSETTEDGCVVSFEEGFSLLVQNEFQKNALPGPGDRLRLFGRGLGFTVRGIGLVDPERVRVGADGAEAIGLIGLYRYQTEDEEQAEREQLRQEQTARRARSWEEGKEDFAARVKALPEVFRQRFEFFMRSQDWGPEFGHYELFSCEEAVKIATFLGAHGDTQAFYRDTDAQKRAQISGEHSGNTFGTACMLAGLYLREPALVPKAHGALCPMVGCQDYGCYASTKEAKANRGRT